MKFALINDQKTDPTPKATGNCQFCGSQMVAKCGNIKIWHWAHKAKSSCDPWWENETEWHRQWKNKFPASWQEVIHVDPSTSEKHIADVKTPHGLVIEFQNSPMNLAEMESREAFYDDMIWIVNGDTNNTLNKGYFMMGLCREPIQKNPLAYQVAWWGRSQFLSNWGKASTKVYLDFGDEVLWRIILYKDGENMAAVAPIDKQAFIEDCLNEQSVRVSYIEEDGKLPEFYHLKEVERIAS